MDVMMLGNGREFVMEVDDPVYRNINLEEFMNAVNLSDSGVYISNIEFSSKNKIREIKEAAYDKIYMATIECDEDISIDNMENTANQFKNLVISQRTPTRVIGNRADLIRKKEIKYINIEDIHDKEAILKIRTQSGTYIASFISLILFLSVNSRFDIYMLSPELFTSSMNSFRENNRNAG